MDLLFGAIDLGATSGRVISGLYRKGRLDISEVYRFSNHPRKNAEKLVWDFDGILNEVKRGIRELGARAERLNLNVTSIGIDTWGVDYGLLASGQLLAAPNSYRDPLNELGVERVHSKLDFSELYRNSGIQFLPFNSIYQLARQEALDPLILAKADRILLLPDLLGFFLTGRYATERTNASTTGLLDASTGDWSDLFKNHLGLPIEKFPPLRDAGEELGDLKPGFGPRLSGAKVVLVGSHDTASAVAAVPASSPNFAFLSSGTWSLLGTELDKPIVTDSARVSNFTNEIGVHGKIRFLKNLSGLWLLNECIRHWEKQRISVSLPALLNSAAAVEVDSYFDVSDSSLISPDDMPEKIQRLLERMGARVPKKPAEFVAVILHSLAKSYADNLEIMSELTGRSYSTLHLIGGGSQNKLLCQLTADYTGIEVEAGPSEATALGNLAIQLQAAKAIGPSLDDLRTAIRNSNLDLITYQPNRRAN